MPGQKLFHKSVANFAASFAAGMRGGGSPGRPRICDQGNMARFGRTGSRGGKFLKNARIILLAATTFAAIGGAASQVSAQPMECWNVWRRGAQFSCPTCQVPEGMPLQSTITDCHSDPNAGDAIGGWSMCGGGIGSFARAAAVAAECGGPATATGGVVSMPPPLPPWIIRYAYLHRHGLIPGQDGAVKPPPPPPPPPPIANPLPPVLPQPNPCRPVTPFGATPLPPVPLPQPNPCHPVTPRVATPLPPVLLPHPNPCHPVTPRIANPLPQPNPCHPVMPATPTPQPPHVNPTPQTSHLQPNPCHPSTPSASGAKAHTAHLTPSGANHHFHGQPHYAPRSQFRHGGGFRMGRGGHARFAHLGASGGYHRFQSQPHYAPRSQFRRAGGFHMGGGGGFHRGGGFHMGGGGFHMGGDGGFHRGGGFHHSDIRLKEAIALLGRFDNGVGLYRFRYRGGDHTVYVGVLAQEIQTIAPSAVSQDSHGYLSVDYQALGIPFMTWTEWVARATAQPVSF
jgi:hypothetical protein